MLANLLALVIIQEKVNNKPHCKKKKRERENNNKNKNNNNDDDDDGDDDDDTISAGLRLKPEVTCTACKAGFFLRKIVLFSPLFFLILPILQTLWPGSP